MKHKKIFLNWDSDAEFFFMQSLGGHYEHLAARAREYLEANYKDCGIGDILFDIFSQNSLTPSKVFTDRLAKYHQTKENGVAVDYTGVDMLRLLKIAREDCGVGLTETWIEHCKTLGIRPWISLRMNDNHYAKDETNWIRSDFFYEAREKGWMLGERARSGAINWNYAISEVQERMLAYIEEQLTALDVFGIELDYMREPKCVKYFEDKNAYRHLNTFMEKVRAVVDRCAAHHGHAIRIAARVPRSPLLSKRVGFDVEYWAKHGLVDAIVPSSHWLGADTGMPIAEWHGMLAPYGVELYPCLEMNLPYKTHIDPETAKAHTVQYADQGADATYIYNFYHTHFEYLYRAGIWVDLPEVEEIQSTWRACGDAEACRRGVRRHILTQECPGFHEIVPRWEPLPKKITYGQGFELQTGTIEPQSELTLFVGIRNATPERLSVLFNGTPTRYLGRAEDAYILKNPSVDREELYAFSLPADMAEPIVQTLGISGDFDAEIFYLELKIDATNWDEGRTSTRDTDSIRITSCFTTRRARSC